MAPSALAVARTAEDQGSSSRGDNVGLLSLGTLASK